jgi:hypothetical protein
MSLSSDIAQEFIEGYYEIYSTFYSTEGLFFLPFDLTTTPSIYDETPDKKYLQAVSVVGNVIFTTTPERRLSEVEQYDAIIDIPAKSFILAGISTEDLAYLRKGVFKHLNSYYSIDSISIGSTVQDINLNYIFQCSVLNGGDLLCFQ